MFAVFSDKLIPRLLQVHRSLENQNSTEYNLDTITIFLLYFIMPEFLKLCSYGAALKEKTYTIVFFFRNQKVYEWYGESRRTVEMNCKMLNERKSIH